MKIEDLFSWQIWLMVISITSFLFSIINFILGKYISSKILNNDLKHLTTDVTVLKEESKEYKGELKEELNRIFKRLGRIEKLQARRDALCEERHTKR